MAEGIESIKEEPSSTKENEEENVLKDDECAVCLQMLQHPARLPCSHIFCYLCIKGIVNQGGRCALCRKPISSEYLDNPQLLHPLDFDALDNRKQFQWYYEGYSGWWQYDERTTIELETAYKKGERSCQVLVAGFVYVADFDSMMQYRRQNPGRRRRIKRDISIIEVKGVAGIRILKPGEPSTTTTQSLDVNELITRTQHLNLNDDSELDVYYDSSDENAVRNRTSTYISFNDSSLDHTYDSSDDNSFRNRTSTPIPISEPNVPDGSRSSATNPEIHQRANSSDLSTASNRQGAINRRHQTRR